MLESREERMSMDGDIFSDYVACQDLALAADCEEGDAPPVAADLSLGLFGQFVGRSLRWSGFDNLQVLILAGQRLAVSDLCAVLGEGRQLQKLDVAQCGLSSVPSSEIWASVQNLMVLLLHRNQIARWADMECVVQAPRLAWLTAFENPIASQPEFRRFVVEHNPDILAIDYTAITDDERISNGAKHAGNSRFLANCETSSVALRDRPKRQPMTPASLLREARSEVRTLQHLSNHCSAACCIQTYWRMVVARRTVQTRREQWTRIITLIQRRIRTFLWRVRMINYLKIYLAEIDELDLLLSAKEMLRLRAAKLIQRTIRVWLSRRRDSRKLIMAADLVARMAKGYMVRAAFIRQHLGLAKQRKVYFPEQYTWEFLVLVNVVRRWSSEEPLPADHTFDVADVIPIRFPEFDEVPVRQALLTTCMSFGTRCLVRKRHAFRFPQHQWDGPFHHVIDTAPPHINKAYDRVKRRGANVNNHCRDAFVRNCVPGPHPLEKNREEASSGPSVHLALKAFLESPDSVWPKECGKDGTAAQLFMREALRIGSRLRRCTTMPVEAHGSVRDPKTGHRIYCETTWLSQRLVWYECSHAKMALDLLFLLLQFGRMTSLAPLVRPIPFIMEKTLKQVSAVVTIQATYRAHLARKALPCGLRTAIVLRRAAICIQRSWRWGILKRRFELLARAARYVRLVKTKEVYIEERLFISMNLITQLDRFAPTISERKLSFGYSDEHESIVLVRDDLNDVAKPGKSATAKEAFRRRCLQREGGLPQWFVEEVTSQGKEAEELKCSAPSDENLKRVCGLQGLLMEGVGEKLEEHVVIQMPSIAHAARLAQDGGDDTSPALIASAGTFRYVELKYSTLAQAKLCALVVFFCTFDARIHDAIPLLSRAHLHDESCAYRVLRLWDFFGLSWSQGDRAAAYQVRQKSASIDTHIVPFCGHPRASHEIRGFFQEVCNRGTQGCQVPGAERREENARATASRFSKLATQLEFRRKQEHEEFRAEIQDVDVKRLTDGRPPGAGEMRVAGALPPTTSSRSADAAVVILVARGEKAAAKSLAQTRIGGELARKTQLRSGIIEGRQTQEKNSATSFEEKALSFYGQCEEDKRVQHENVILASRDAAEAQQKLALAALHLEMLHKHAEAELWNKVTWEEKRNNEALREQEELHEQSLDRHYAALDCRRQHIQLMKEEGAAKREAQKAMKSFQNSRALYERASMEDEATRVHHQKVSAVCSSFSDTKFKWAQRSQELEQKNSLSREHRDRELAAFQARREVAMLARGHEAQLDLDAKRERIADKKVVEALVSATRTQIENCVVQPGSSRAQPSACDVEAFEQTLDAFKQLTERVNQRQTLTPESFFVSSPMTDSYSSLPRDQSMDTSPECISPCFPPRWHSLPPSKLTARKDGSPMRQTDGFAASPSCSLSPQKTRAAAIKPLIPSLSAQECTLASSGCFSMRLTGSSRIVASPRQTPRLKPLAATASTAYPMSEATRSCFWDHATASSTTSMKPWETATLGSTGKWQSRRDSEPQAGSAGSVPPGMLGKLGGSSPLVPTAPSGHRPLRRPNPRTGVALTAM